MLMPVEKQRVTIEDRMGGRDNHFNLIRFVAALAVLVTHSFALSSGHRENQPLWTTYGMTPGSIAVDVFFVTSGFLVCHSLFSRQNLLEFAAARALRILPALWVVLAITVVLVGPTLTTLNLGDFARSHETWRYVIKNASIVSGMAPTLPGVFEHNAVARLVNSSLWTLYHEVWLYACLCTYWILAGLIWNRRVPWVSRLILLSCFVAAVLTVYSRLTGWHYQWPRLAFAFFTGASFYVLRGKIKLSGVTACVLALALTIASVQRDVFYVVYSAAVGYLVLFAAYARATPLLAFNRLGDYSYGVYIYGFLVQQLLVNAFPGIGTGPLMAASIIATLVCGMASWHLIEKPALSKKAWVSARINPSR
jgi:peptidoglycan/LPS O-acetylase OafA/YrhL